MITIGLLTLVLLIARVNKPGGSFFDEFGYVGVARNLLHGTLGSMPQEFSEASVGRQHPPLGPYLIAQGIRIAGDDPLGWRLPGVICGVLTVAAVFLWTYLLVGDYGLAWISACLTLFNNFLFVMSRTAMLDVFVFTFAIWAVVAFTFALTSDIGVHTRRILVILSGSLFGLSAACKWNAVDSLAAVWIIAGALLFPNRYARERNPKLGLYAKNINEIGLPSLFFGFVLAPFIFYAIAFLPMFHAMQLRFSVPEFVKLNTAMLTLTKGAPGNLTQFAPWYTWPFRITPNRALSYLVGNPVVMWGGLLALAVCLRRVFQRIVLAEAMVITLYAANLLQWAVTPLKVPNYYYYYSAAMLLGVAIALALHRPVPQRLFGIRLSFLVVVAAFLVFLYCYPRMAYLEPPWDCMFGCWN